MSRHQHRISQIVLAFGAFSVLIALGAWQLERRAWKNDLLARFELALSKPAAPYEPPHSDAADPAREFRRVKLTGEFQTAETVRVLMATPQALRGQTQEGFGYLVFTPLKFGNGVVFVNRGFVPQSLGGDAALFPAGPTTVTGILRRAETPGSFTPAPDASHRLFYASDIPAMAAAAGVEGDRVVLSEYVEAETPGKIIAWPKGRDPRDLLAAIPNRHLEYALTWFGLAVALAGVYGLYIMRA